MKTEAAVLWGVGGPWSVEVVDLGDPKEGEVRVRMVAAGLCHTDEHLVTGDEECRLPIVGGHEGSGIVEETGPGVTSLVVGDHVVLTFIPSCGRCRWCGAGMQNLCDRGAEITTGVALSDGAFRIRARDQDVGAYSLLGAFSRHVVVHESSAIKIEDSFPLEEASLLSCGVTTGWAAAVHAAGVRAGETVAVVGVGGVGSAAIQGAKFAGASVLVAVDPVELKRDNALSLGASHAAGSAEAAFELIRDLTAGSMADAVILTVGVLTGEILGAAMTLLGKGGRAVVTGMAPMAQRKVDLDLFDLTVYQKQIRGSLFGSISPRVEIPRLMQLWRRGQLELTELVTRKYALEQINEGYQDMRAGRNIRGLIVFQ